ncbi:MAG: MFS transporter [Rhodospirillales bacterium CG15_BIG_FIL_POST_REV_8_21_14_020_66_15]|nr:MAG: MFS transporter [Rhodospirillales bacterium CG15_BIG_FIL_POST_REV_8_21_14_020_66_15]
MTAPINPAHNTRNLAILAFCQALFFSGRTLTFFAASLVAISMLGKDLSLATAPITMMLIGTSAGTLPAAFLMRAWGRRWGFAFGSAVGCIGALIAAQAIALDSFLLFNAGLLISGIYAGFAQQYRFAAAEVAPEHLKEKNVSIVIAMSVIGAFVGPETALLAKHWISAVPFQGAFWMLAVFYALSGVVILFADMPRLTKQEHDDSGRPLTTIMASPTFIVAVIAALFGYVVMNFLMVVTPVTMETIKTVVFSHENIKLVIQWHVVGMFLPGFVTGHLINRFGVVRTIAAGAAILLCSVLVALSGTSFAHFLTALILLGVGWNFTFTGGTILVTEVHTPAERAKVQGANDFLLFTGLAISSLLAGSVYHHLGWEWVNYAMLPVILVILLSALWLRVVRRRERALAEAAAQ